MIQDAKLARANSGTQLKTNSGDESHALFL